MSTWPGAPVNLTNLDAGNDSPANARADLLDAAQKLNKVIAALGAALGVASLDSSGLVPQAQIPITPVAKGMVSFQTAGTATWTVPAGVYRIQVELWGGGGGGGYGDTRSVPTTPHGGGGGAGGGVIVLINVTPGDIWTYVVGAGGTGGVGPTNAGGGNGAASTFTRGAVSYSAGGGLNGTGGDTGGVGGSGGLGSGGNVNFSGGSAGSGIPGQGGIGGSNARSGSAPLAPGYGFGGGGYGSGTGGPASGFDGAPGGVIITW